MGNTKRACAANPVPCGCWRGRGACPPPGSPPREGSRGTRRPSCRGACAAPWRGRGASDVLSGGVEADDLLLAARDRARRRDLRARSRYSRRPGAFRAGAGTVPQGCPGLRGRDVSLPTSASRDPQP